MKKLQLKLNATAICLLLSINLIYSQLDYKGFPEWSIESEGSTNYAFYTPSNIEPGKLYPIALFLHGCCGSDNVARLRNAVDPPVRMWHNFGENTQTEPTYIISPATQSGWSQHFSNLKAVIDDLIANHQGDPQRVYITGFSMGGRGTWEFINMYPDYFAAALPMGMDMQGSASTIKDIPIWTNRGETCGWSTNLESQVASIRVENGDSRGGDEWVTGVNARFTEFEGVGHGVQWAACSTQDMVGWALSIINDGNAFPNVFFNSPDYLEEFAPTDEVPLNITALDSDGSISKVEIYVNGILNSVLNSSPYLDTVSIHPGDNKIEATAYDDGGKIRTATIIVRTDNSPTLSTIELPDARQGALYEKQLFANGNAPFTYEISGSNDALPQGLSLSSDGLIKGIPTVTGSFTIGIIVNDADVDNATSIYSLEVLPKHSNEVIITNASVETGTELAISKLKDLELPNTESGNEVSISDAGVYEGLTFIATSNADEDNTSASYLSFDVDEDVTVYIGYEVKNLLYSSTVPSWLSNDYTLETANEIVSQYRYREVYSRNFSAGTITIPGADAEPNNADVNYLVAVKMQGTTLNTTPVITTSDLPDGNIGYLYEEKLSVIDGEGTITWSLTSGSLPDGFALSANGTISGPASVAGIYNFEVQARDAAGDLVTKSLSIEILSTSPIQPINIVANDTTIMENSPTVTLVLNNISNHSSPTQNIDMIAYTHDGTLISVTTPVKINDTTFSITYTPVSDQTGDATIYLETTDHNNSNVPNTIKAFVVTIEPIILTFDLTTASSGNGTVSPTGTNTYDENSYIEITASPSTGYAFSNWTGDVPIGEENTNPLTVLITADASLTANFELLPSYTLTVNEGTGSGTFYMTEQTTISANTPPTDHVFDAWIGDIAYVGNANQATTTVTMPGQDINLTATYRSNAVPTYTLAVTNGSGSGDYAEGAVVPIVANDPPANQVFDAWTGDIAYLNNANNASATVTMPGNEVNLTATYRSASVATYTLTVTNGSGSGEYAEGAVVPIVANEPPTGQKFDGWSGDIIAVANADAATTTITMAGINMSITAEYVAIGTSTQLYNSPFDFIVYPNPASEMVNIISSEKISQANIYSLTSVLVKTIDIPNSLEVLIDVKDFKEGIYFIEVVTNKGRKVKLQLIN